MILPNAALAKSSRQDNDEKAECVVTDEGNGILEIKNIAVDPKYHRMGYGKVMIDFLANKYEKE